MQIKGQIRPVGDDLVVTKFTLVVQTLQHGIPKNHTYNINSDQAVPKFSSTGNPDDFNLTITYNADTDLAGSPGFDGIVGNNKIYIKIGSSVEVTGDIIGGPKDGQKFVGNGSWLG
jgi:hypothetical protein